MSQTGYFAAGCFWGVEQAFRSLEGVLETEVGYTGGHKANPSYEEVCRKTTGHAEAVKVIFDPNQVTYHELLTAFWAMHDPTQVNRQGPDVGDQYRSAIFTANADQMHEATSSRDVEEASSRYKKPIATLVEPLADWWPAEEYHQQYFEKRGGGACAISLPS